MTRAAKVGLCVLAFLVGLVLVVRFTGCDRKPTKAESNTDSVLATVPAWKDTVLARDAVIKRQDQARERERLARIAERKRADRAEAKADSLQAWADTLALIPEGTASDSVMHLLPALAAQKKASVQFALTVDSLKVDRTADSTRLETANGTIGQMKSWRVEDLARIDILTTSLDDLREDTRHKGKWNVLGLHLPGYVKDVVMIGTTAVVAYRVGRAAS